MATVLLSDPDERTRVLLQALLEALGHRVVEEDGLERVAAAVIEPASPAAMRMVQRLRTRGDVPVVCVSSRRRGAAALRLDPVAYIAKPVPVGTFIRAVAAAVDESARVAVAAA